MPHHKYGSAELLTCSFYALGFLRCVFYYRRQRSNAKMEVDYIRSIRRVGFMRDRNHHAARSPTYFLRRRILGYGTDV